MDGRGLLHRKKLILHLLFVTLIILWGLFISLYYGRIGFMPLDQSIVFDGAWRIISHQLPYKDFILPYGLTPILMQTIFFNLFGINWLSYCLHAAVINALFGLTIFYFLLIFNTPCLLSFFYASLSCIIFYPPFGVPYVDQHSAFFALLSIFMVILINRLALSPFRIFLISLSTFFLFLSFLSKPVLPFFISGIIVICFFILSPNKQLSSLFIFFSSLTIIFLTFIIILFIFGINFSHFYNSLFRSPLRLGQERFLFFWDNYSLSKLIHSLFYPNPIEPFTLRLYCYPIIYLTFIFFLLSLIYPKTRTGLQRDKNILSEIILIIFLSVSLIITCNIFTTLTLNQGENGLFFLFLSLGLSHLALMKIGNTLVQENIDVYKLFISLVFICVALHDGYIFNHKVNQTRLVHDMIFQRESIYQRASLPDSLKFMVFATPTKYAFTANNLKRTIDFLKKQRANFFLIGDSSIIYGLTGRPSVNPVLWFHPGLTLPYVESNAFLQYEYKLIQNLKKYRAKFLVIEGEMTWFNLSLANFKILPSLIEKDSAENKKFGSFVIYRINLSKINH